MKKLFLTVTLAALIAALAGEAFADPIGNHWGGAGTPVSNYWNNDSNWELGIPIPGTDHGHKAMIRSRDELTEEHVTIQSGNTGYGDWVTIGGTRLVEGDSIVPLAAAHLTVEAGATLYWCTDEEQWGQLEMGHHYNGTLNNYGTCDGYGMWPQSERDKMVYTGEGTGPAYAMVPRVEIGYHYDGGFPSGGVGVMNCYDGSYTRTGSVLMAPDPSCKGYMNIYEGAYVFADFVFEMSIADGAPTYSELNLLGGTLHLEDVWNPIEGSTKLYADFFFGKADGMFTTGAKAVVNLDSGVLYVDGDFAYIQGTANIGKDVDATINGNYLIRPLNWVSVYTTAVGGGRGMPPQHPDANDFLTGVEIDIDPQTSVATNSTVVVGGDTHMDGHLYVENSRDRPKEGDQFTLFDGDAGQTHDGSFLSVTTNLTGGSAGYSVAVVTGDWIATFTGLTGGDANADHKVSIGDLSIMAGNWNQTGFTNGYADADFNGDSAVGIGDLSIMAANWSWFDPIVWGGPVPEPATLSLLCLGGLALIRRRR